MKVFKNKFVIVGVIVLIFLFIPGPCIGTVECDPSQTRSVEFLEDEGMRITDAGVCRAFDLEENICLDSDSDGGEFPVLDDDWSLDSNTETL